MEAIRDFPDATYNEIAELLGIPKKMVSYHARHGGVNKRPRKDRKYPMTLQSIEADLARLKEQIAELEQKRESLRIRYEVEGSNVVLHGVGEQPFVANWRDWLRWLNGNGGHNLREFVTKHFVNGGVQ